MTGDAIATRLADVVRSVEYKRLDARTVRTAKARLLDAVGNMVSGLRTPAFAAVKRYLGAGGRISEEHAVRAGELADIFPSRSLQIDSESYGFVTGAPAFIENYGDTSLSSVAHPNTVIVPAALVAARLRPVAGHELVAGIVAGYQVMEFLGRTLNNGRPRMSHQVRGFRPTATCGPAGAAGVIAKLWSIDGEDLAQCLSVACNLAAGLRRTDAGEVTHMRIHSGEAVRNGVEAVLLVRSGLRVDDEFIEGRGGFLDALSGGANDEGASVYLDEPLQWAIDDVALKIHATPHTLAPGLDCLIDLARSDPELFTRVHSIRIFVPDAHAQISLGAAQVDPADLTAISALDHYPFCAAIALITADVVFPNAPAAFVGRSDVIDLARRIEIAAGERETKIFEDVPGSWPVRVEVVTDDGETVVERMVPFGAEFDDAVERSVERKFLVNTEQFLDPRLQDRVTKFVGSIEESDDVYRDLVASMGLPD